MFFCFAVGTSTALAQNVVSKDEDESGGMLSRAVRRVIVDISSRSPVNGFFGQFGSGRLSDDARRSLHICTIPDQSRCDQFMNMGCSATSSGAVPGSVECWRGDRFRLLTNEGDGFLTQASQGDGNYLSLAKISGGTGPDFYSLRRFEDQPPVLLDENGSILLESGSVECASFVGSPKSGRINCLSGTKDNPKSYSLDVERLQQIDKGAINLKDAVDSFEIDLCGLTMNALAAKAQKKEGFIESIWMSVIGDRNRVDFEEIAGPGKVSVGVIQPKGNYTARCTLAPKNDVMCTAIILVKTGVECQQQGGLVAHTVPLENVGQETLVKIAKKRIFKDRDVVGIKEILAQGNVEPRATLRVTRPDLLFSKNAKWIFPAGSGGGTSTGSGQN